MMIVNAGTPNMFLLNNIGRAIIGNKFAHTLCVWLSMMVNTV